MPNADYIAMCDRVLATGAMMRACGSGALGLVEVAAGRIDGYVERHINLWDVAAALAVLAEAGAVTSDFLGAVGWNRATRSWRQHPGSRTRCGLRLPFPGDGPRGLTLR